MVPSCSVCSGTPKTSWRSIPACADCSRDSSPPRRHDALRGRGSSRETQRRQVHALERPGWRAPRDRLPQTAVHPPAGGRPAHAGRHAVHLHRLAWTARARIRSEEHTSELQSLAYLVCRLLLEKKKKNKNKETRIKSYVIDSIRH